MSSGSGHGFERWLHGFPLWGEVLLWIAWFAFCLGAIVLLLRWGRNR